MQSHLQASSVKRIVALGDSLTAGYQLNPVDAFPALVERKLRQSGFPDIEVVNEGISGTTTVTAAARFDEILREGKPDILILALGANDGLRGMPIDQAKRNLARVIQAAQQQDVQVLLVGMRFRGLTYYGSNYPAQFEQLYTDLAANYGVPLVPFLLQGVVGNPALNLADGLHPNENGHKIMAKTVIPFLLPMLNGSSTVKKA